MLFRGSAIEFNEDMQQIVKQDKTSSAPINDAVENNTTAVGLKF